MLTYAGLAARRVDGDSLPDLEDTLVFLHRQPVKLAPRAIVRGKPVGECWRGIFNRCVLSAFFEACHVTRLAPALSYECLRPHTLVA